MKTILYYFSGTGNSYAVARDISGLLGDTELVSIPRALKEGIKGGADAIGIVFPVYIWGMPLVVDEFCGKLKNSDAKYFFAVCTCGGFPGAALVQAEETLAGRGIKLSAGFSVKMPGNYTPMYGAIAPEKQKKMFAAEKEKIKKIALAVKESKFSSPEKSNFLINMLVTGLFYKFAAPHMPEMDNRFFADKKCNSCGLCARYCPAGNITMKDGKPEWQHKCYQCFACLQWCPVEAIQYGEKTEKRKRYRHPEVKVEEFLPQ